MSDSNTGWGPPPTKASEVTIPLTDREALALTDHTLEMAMTLIRDLNAWIAYDSRVCDAAIVASFAHGALLALVAVGWHLREEVFGATLLWQRFALVIVAMVATYNYWRVVQSRPEIGE